MKVAVLGSGAGALAVAAELSRSGRDTMLADLPQFRQNLNPVREAGAVAVTSDWHGVSLEPVGVAEDLAAAVADATLVVVVVPCFGHEPFSDALAALLDDGQAVLFLGEGSGSIVARRALLAATKPGVIVGEANTLPYLARPAGPGKVTVFRKSGGVMVAGLPASSTAPLLTLVGDVWEYISAAASVWETVLVNYNAIDHVATMVGNASTLENRAGGMLLWGEGATPAIVRAIEAVDGELLAIRVALGMSDRRRYRDFLVAQGFAPDVGPDLYETMMASRLVTGYAPTASDGGLDTRYITEDVPYALVLASSLGRATATPTPVIDALIALTSAMAGRDFRTEGRTLDRLGLGGLDAAGLSRFSSTGEFPL